jgi:UDP-galactopyranose mutase
MILYIILVFIILITYYIFATYKRITNKLDRIIDVGRLQKYKFMDEN